MGVIQWYDRTSIHETQQQNTAIFKRLITSNKKLINDDNFLQKNKNMCFTVCGIAKTGLLGGNKRQSWIIGYSRLAERLIRIYTVNNSQDCNTPLKKSIGPSEQKTRHSSAC